LQRSFEPFSNRGDFPYSARAGVSPCPSAESSTQRRARASTVSRWTPARAEIPCFIAIRKIDPAEPTPARWEARRPPLKRGFHLPYSADGASAAGGGRGDRRGRLGNRSRWIAASVDRGHQNALRLARSAPKGPKCAAAEMNIAIPTGAKMRAGRPRSKMARCTAVPEAASYRRADGQADSLTYMGHSRAAWCANAYSVYSENRLRMATNRDHRGSGKALKPGLPHYGSTKAFRPTARTSIFVLHSVRQWT